MVQIVGGNNPGNVVHVDGEGKIQARAVSITEQSSKSLFGDTYNLNTGKITLTSDVNTPVFHFKNDAEDKPMVITRVFVTFLTSTDGVGEVVAAIESGVSGGTLLTGGTEVDPKNFNFGSSKTPAATFIVGATGLTFSGGIEVPNFLFTGDNQRQTIPFDAIILPRGASATFTLIPPPGNTSMVVQAGANVYIDGDF